MKIRRLLTLALALSTLALGACKKPSDSTSSDFGAAGAGWGSDDWASGGGGSGSLPSRSGGYSFFGPGSGNVLKGQFAPVYFAFDSFQVSGGEMSKVREVANYANRNGSKVLVAGFTDTVGTEEYNRGLGDRRALAVRQALISSGVSAGNIQTVSFGEEMLADTANPTSGQNRRVEFGIVR